MYNWDLSDLYLGLDDKQYQLDFLNIVEDIEELENFANSLDKVSKASVVGILERRNKLSSNLRKVISFLSLNESVDSANNEYKNQMQKAMQLAAKTAEPQAKMDAHLASITNLDELCSQDDLILQHKFYIEEIMSEKPFQLSAKEEGLISKLNLNGVNTWQDLYNYLTSTFKLDYLNEKVTITQIRNLAYSPDQAVRKAAYKAELAGYKDIESSLAYSLNSIKGHVNTMVELRGYDSALHMTLKASRMEKATLDAMFLAIDDSLPKFRQFLKHKGKLLGHNFGLPFYDLFAPVVESDKEYTVEKAQEMITESFATFSDDLLNLVKTAFEDNWIDYLPKENKRGGAFCANLPMIKQSRVMSNFGNDLSGVVTLAHELGHAYHGLKIQDHHMLNTSYVMPIAETASNFCELILSEAALKTADKNEKIQLLENMISDATQVIVDIYSRFLFEQSVFENRQDSLLMADDLVKLMEDAQLKTYGDGLDKDYLHGYMWACKGHYYSSNRNYYNFPYAYGGLFAKGLYAKYLEEGESFVPKYDQMLTNTTVASCEDIGKMVGVDVSQKKFWSKSLGMIENMIDEFINLTSEEA